MRSNDSGVTGNDQAMTVGMLRRMSGADFARLGVEQVAYIRPVVVNGVAAVAIHAADGTPIGAAPNAELAAAAIVEHEMAPVLLH